VLATRAGGAAYAGSARSARSAGAELAVLAGLARFTDKGVALEAAEALADRLVARDREADERRLCLECVHLAGRADAWECRNWQQTAIASKARDAQLSPALVIQPQRCDGFKAAT